MKYYYDCPIKAYYMKKYFNMDYAGPKSELGKELGYNFVDNYRFLDENKNTVCWKSSEGKIYIEPSSLHLLEPQSGDLVSINGGESANVIMHEELFRDRLKLMEPQFSKPLTIIQRNGKPFFWPEAEE